MLRRGSWAGTLVPPPRSLAPRRPANPFLNAHPPLPSASPPPIPQVRSGPVDLPLLKKPLDLTLRRARRLTSRGPDLHISVRGVAE